MLLLQGLLPVASIYLLKLVVDGAASAIAGSGGSFGEVLVPIALLAAVAGAQALLRALASYASQGQSLAVGDHVQGLIVQKSLAVDLAYYENPKYHDTLHRAQQEASFRPTNIVNGLVQLLQNGISLAAMVGLLVAFHPAVAAALFAAALPGLAVRLRFARRMFGWRRERTPIERRIDYVGWILTGDIHAKEVRLFGLGPLLSRRFADLRRDLRAERLSLAGRFALADTAAQFVAVVAIYGSLAFIVYRAFDGRITVGDLVMYFQAFQRGQGFLTDMLRALANLYEDNLFLSNLAEFLSIEPRVRDPENPRSVPDAWRLGISVENVSFRYEGASENVLEDVSLDIRPGEVVALVGPNGAGKTTLVKLLCRLHDPTGGRIALEGVDLRQYRLADLRRRIAAVFQDFARYHLTLRENVAFGDPDRPPGDPAIEEAARRSGAAEVAGRLPRGYDTILGRFFEDGEELSIGEWQKVALGRAFLRDANLVILDEPTSALDAHTEARVFEAFRDIAEGRSAVIVSHRFSTVRMADRIVVLDRGRVVEQGSHDDLVARRGRYAEMFEIQARSYR